jgi:L-threonylcarbamoyladenylate synthase
MNNDLLKVLIDAKYAVFPTDTVYGIHTLALNEPSVNKLYSIRGRAPSKPFIILVASIDQIALFDVSIENKTTDVLNKYWPGKVSVVLPCNNPKFGYLHRGTNTLAFRIPDKKDLLELLSITGPLISTSVNPEGMPPAKTIDEAKRYFGDRIDYYLDKGEVISEPSTLISVTNGEIIVLRQGAVKIE